MFEKLRDPRGSATLYLSAAALLALAGIAGCLPLPGGLHVVLAVALAVGAAACAVAGWFRDHRRRYDLSALWDSPPADRAPVEPLQDTVTDEEAHGPYCGWCDETYPLGTHRCRGCGRELG